MQPIRDLLGINVNKPEKLNIGSVKDVYLNPGTSLVVAVLIEQAGLLGKKTLIPWDFVTYINDEGLWIKSEEVPKIKLDDTWWSVASKGDDSAYGRDLLVQNGESLGTVGDYLIDPDSGIIVGCELSGGILQDLIEGRKYLHGGVTLAEDGNSLLFHE